MPPERIPQNIAKYAINGAAVFIGIVGVIFHVDQMYLMAVALGLLPWASRQIGRVMADGIACERRLPAMCGVGEAVPVTLTLTNTGRLPKLALWVMDRLPRWLRPVGERAAVIMHLRPGESRAVTYLLEPERRGVHPVGPALVEMTDPLGFHSFVQRVGEQAEIVVYPTPLPLRRVFFAGAAAPGWRTQEAARVRGPGTEFQGVREYQPGDELRHVHWRTTARTGALAVAEYAQGASRDAVIALDLSRAAYADTGEGDQSALEYAVTLAVSLCDFLLRQGHAVRLLTPRDAAGLAPPAAGPAQMPRILETLARVEADSPLTLAETLARARLRPAAGTALIYITPDWDDPALAAALGDDAARGAQVFGLALQADSFRGAPARRQAAKGADAPGTAWPVRRGDDLRRILEG
ncbi:MAG: DUF58 domain-containing protein [Armatimonadetes bacterium]|nr:DUF58 domain-containing protein [Armatimonadota bacterium]